MRDLREPVRSAPPPPRGRPNSVHRQAPGHIDKRPVLEAIGGPGPAPAPHRPHRGPGGRAAPAQPPAPRRQGVRPPPKKKPPPRPPPPKFQPTQDRLPPTYEQVLQEDAAVLAGFGFGTSSASNTTSASTSDDLIDFDATVTAPAPPITRSWEGSATWDAPLPSWDAPSAAPTPTPSSSSSSARAPVSSTRGPTVTIIRPLKPSGSSSSRGRAPPAPTVASGDDAMASPPMPSVPPPPPPLMMYMEDSANVRPPTPPPRPGSAASSSADAPQATAVYDFQSSEPGDLSFKAGETVVLRERLNAEWLRGRCRSREGIFPVAYVEVTVPLPGEEAAEQGSGITAEVLYDFPAEEPQDLPLTVGEHVLVLGRLNDEWGQGSIHGRTGSFPLAFVDVDPAVLPAL